MNALPKRLKLCPTPGIDPLQNIETGQAVKAETLGLNDSLCAEIMSWDAIYQSSQGQDASHLSPDEERAWVKQGQQIAAELAAQWPHEFVIRLSKLESIVQKSMLNLKPEQWYSEAHAQLIAQQCRVAEIIRTIERLNELAIEKSNTPEWDDDKHEDVAKAQRLFALILAALPSQYLYDVAQGLYSPHSGTRVYVAIAMAKHGELALSTLEEAHAQEKDPVTAQLLDLVIEPIKNMKH